MTKTPTPNERRAARLAEIAAGKADNGAQSRERAEAAAANQDPAVADAGLNKLVLLDVAEDVAALGDVVSRLKAQADIVIPISSETELWIAQVATLAQVQANIIHLGAVLIAQTTAAIAAAEAG